MSISVERYVFMLNEGGRRKIEGAPQQRPFFSVVRGWKEAVEPMGTYEGAPSTFKNGPPAIPQ